MGLFNNCFYLLSSSFSGRHTHCLLSFVAEKWGILQRRESGAVRRSGQWMTRWKWSCNVLFVQSICLSVFLLQWLRLSNFLAAGIPEVSGSQIGIHTGKAAAADCGCPALSHSHQLQISLALRWRKTASRAAATPLSQKTKQKKSSTGNFKGWTRL